MTVEVKFEDNDHIYTVDFYKLAKKLNLTVGQIQSAIDELIRKS